MEIVLQFGDISQRVLEASVLKRDRDLTGQGFEEAEIARAEASIVRQGFADHDQSTDAFRTVDRSDHLMDHHAAGGAMGLRRTRTQLRSSRSKRLGEDTV